MQLEGQAVPEAQLLQTQEVEQQVELALEGPLGVLQRPQDLPEQR